MSGLMGAVAHGALDAGGQVHGIIPRAFVMTGEKGQVRAGEGEREGERNGVIGTTKLGGGESTVVGGMHEVRLKRDRSRPGRGKGRGRRAGVVFQRKYMRDLSSADMLDGPVL
jgi:hypothetical protein